MRLKKLTLFFLGSIAGVVATIGYKQLKTHKISEVEVALGDFLYAELQKFPKKWSIENISQRLQDLDKGQLKIEEEAKDRILLNLAAEAADLEAKKHLDQATNYLKSLAIQKDVTAIVPNKVYVQILREGDGEIIRSDDVVSVLYKEYDLQGNLLKDTEDKAFDIPLGKMIKGFKLGVSGARVGERRKIYVHPDYGFGKIGRGQHSNQLLIYEITIVKKISV